MISPSTSRSGLSRSAWGGNGKEGNGKHEKGEQQGVLVTDVVKEKVRDAALACREPCSKRTLWIKGLVLQLRVEAVHLVLWYVERSLGVPVLLQQLVATDLEMGPGQPAHGLKAILKMLCRALPCAGALHLHGAYLGAVDVRAQLGYGLLKLLALERLFHHLQKRRRGGIEEQEQARTRGEAGVIETEARRFSQSRHRQSTLTR